LLYPEINDVILSGATVGSEVEGSAFLLRMNQQWFCSESSIFCFVDTAVQDMFIDSEGSAITTISSREFSQHTGRAKRAAKQGPVLVTDRGRPTHVLLTMRDYQKLANRHGNILDLLAMPRASKVEFEPPRLTGELHRPANF
jgi:prevent-host-death family protein